MLLEQRPEAVEGHVHEVAPPARLLRCSLAGQVRRVWAEPREELASLGTPSVLETSRGLDEGRLIPKSPGQLQEEAQGRPLIPA